MSNLEEKIEELEKIILESRKSKFSSFVKYIGTILTVIVLGSGIIANWTTMKSALANVENVVKKQEEINDRQDKSIIDVQLNAVRDSSDIRYIKEKVDNNSKKLDRLLELPR